MNKFQPGRKVYTVSLHRSRPHPENDMTVVSVRGNVVVTDKGEFLSHELGVRTHEHKAYEPDNCPLCGTSAKIGGPVS